MGWFNNFEKEARKERNKTVRPYRLLVFGLALQALSIFAFLCSVPFNTVSALIVVSVSVAISYYVHPIEKGN